MCLRHWRSGRAVSGRRKTDTALLAAFRVWGILACLAPFAGRAGGTLTNCTESAFDAALLQGGNVILACDGVLTITQTKLISIDTAVDATGHTVTLSGRLTNRLFTVNPGVTLSLRNLTLANGSITGAGGRAGAGGEDGAAGAEGAGGAIYVDGGGLVATDTTFNTNRVIGGTGGNGGAGLGTGDGGAGGRGGPANGGALFNRGGWVRLTNCVFYANQATGGGGGTGGDGGSAGNGGSGGDGGDGGTASGGALGSTAGGTNELVDCSFVGNSAIGSPGGVGGAGGGGLGVNGMAGAAAAGGGGAFFLGGGQARGVGCTFDTGNALGANGGNGWDGLVERPGQKGSAGGAGNGGGILNSGGALALTNCTFHANLASGGNGGSGGKGGDSFLGAKGGDGGTGGAANGGGVHNLANGSTILVNCTFAANSAEGGQGGEGGIPTGVAVPGGDGSAGPRRGGALANAEGTVTLKNALLAAGASGNGASGTITDGGNNLSSDATPPFSSASSHNNSELLLGTFGEHGGLTSTLDLTSGSPAIDAGNSSAALPTDQRGVARDGVCDIGAYEYTGSAPAITPIPDRTVNELTALTFTVTATDLDIGQAITYSLGAGAPPGSAIDPAAGAFSWTPTEAQGPGAYPISVIATDNGTPPGSATDTFQITVSEVNTAPALNTPPDLSVLARTVLTFTATGTDADLPPQGLTYSLGAGNPAGSAIDPVSGLFTWTPSAAQAPMTNAIQVIVRDNATPPLGATNTVRVLVQPNPPPTPQIVSPAISVNDLGFSCSVQTVTGATYFLDFKSSLTQASWTVIGQGVPGDGSLTVLIDPDPTAPAGFYRVRAQ